MTYEINGARQRFIETNGVTLSVYEAGEPRADRPTIVCSHGFPELAFSWRHQLQGLADAGYHVLAPDQRGYGGSTRPDAVTDYDIFHLTGDLVGLLDEFGLDKAVFLGHDWGGFVVWQMPHLHPTRTAGVMGLCTPYTPRFPMKPTELFRMVGGENFYIVWFQTPEVPDQKLAANVPEVFEHLLRRAVEPGALLSAAGADAASKPMGDFVDLVVNGPLTSPALVTPEELAVFVDAFTETGFTGGINWYRNFDRNWELTPEQEGAHIDGVPCLMVTAEWDPVLRPSMAQGMPEVIEDLEMAEVAKAGHWIQQEYPAEVNAVLIDWLDRRFT